MGNLPVGIIFIIIGTILLIVIDRRKFYRRIEREEGEESNKKAIQKLQVEALLRVQ